MRRFVIAGCFFALLPLAACGSSDSSSGSGGSSGTGGSSGSGGSSGTGGTAGASGASGTGGSAGSAGSSGTAGSGGAAGMAGSGGSAGAAGGSAGAAGSAGSAGAAGAGGNIHVEATCAFTPCGGDPSGTWNYTDVCLVDSEVFAALYNACASATVDSASGTVTGSLSMLGAKLVLNATTTVNATVTLPQSCAFGQCAQIQGALAQGFPGATCSAGTATGSCTCNISKSTNAVAGGTYTVSGNTVTTSGGRTYDFCVSGSTLEYHETTATNPQLGVYTLSKN